MACITTYLTYLHDLIILNNRLLRILQHKSLITNVQHLYIAFNTLPVNKLFQFQMLVHAHAIYFQLPSLPEIFQLSHKRNSEIHSYNTRHSQDFHRLSVTSIYGKKSHPISAWDFGIYYRRTLKVKEVSSCSRINWKFFYSLMRYKLIRFTYFKFEN